MNITSLLMMPAARLTLALGLGIFLAGCGERSAQTTGAPPDTTSDSEQATTAPVALQDVIENTPTHLVGISYAPGLDASPALAQVLSGYADQARKELMQALAELGNDSPRVPYELSLGFEQTVNTPRIKAVAADGSLYTGGAHGMPLVARFVWLVDEDRLLTADELVPATASRQAIADHVERVLLDQVQTRVREDRMDPAVERDVLDNARSMIAEGTEPVSENFRQFQPVMDGQGRIAAIRFVFPPYQVGPYSDGVQTVDVPAAVMLPHVDPRYASLFASAAQ